MARDSLAFSKFFLKCSLKCFACHITLWLVSVPLVWHLHVLKINKKVRHTEELGEMLISLQITEELRAISSSLTHFLELWFPK